MTLRRLAGIGTALALTTFALAACGSGDSLDGDSAPADGSATTDDAQAADPGQVDAIVVGSQDYYSSEIIAEIYAQALEAEGYEVDRDYRIGQREVYMAEVESGAIDVFPEYTGPLLQYWVPDNEVTGAEDIYTALADAAPDNLQILDYSQATDQDSYVVTREFAENNNVWSLADLADYDGTVMIGANSELQTRPNGPDGLRNNYGIEVDFTPIEDSGGPLTIKALVDGDIDVANIYTASPAIDVNDLVVLEDPEGLFLAANVVPVASSTLDQGAIDVINDVSSRLSADDLVALNARSVEDQESAATIAGDWLAENLN